jgi:pimeloyl-ACP methyl ester carboxylesterase
MPFLDLPDHSRLFFLDENSASPDTVLLLHGLGADSSSWGFQVGPLTSAGLRVIAPDAPGFGKSSGARSVGSIRRLSQFIPRLLDNLKIPTARIAGISMGGTLALQTALDHPERVERLALINTFARLSLMNPRVIP